MTVLIEIAFSSTFSCSHRRLTLFCFSQNGFDYLLTYSDDPQTVFPRYCVSWMVSSGEFLSLIETCKISVSARQTQIYEHF